MSIFENFGRKTIFIAAKTDTEATNRIVAILATWSLEDKNLLLEIAVKDGVQKKLRYAKKFV